MRQIRKTTPFVDPIPSIQGQIGQTHCFKWPLQSSRARRHPFVLPHASLSPCDHHDNFLALPPPPPGRVPWPPSMPAVV